LAGKKELRGAIDKVNQAIKLAPRESDVLHLRGRLLPASRKSDIAG